MKKIIVTVVKLAITISILLFIFMKFQIGWGEIVAAFATSRQSWFLISIGTQLAAVAFSILRWHVLLKAQRFSVPFPRLVTTYLVGRFLGTFTPTGVGLEAYKAYDIARYTSRPTEAVTVVFVEKFLTLLALSLLVLITLTKIELNIVFIAVFFVFLLFILALLVVLIYKAALLDSIAQALPFHAKTSGPVRKAVASFDNFRSRKAAMGLAIIYAMGVYFCLFATFYTNGVALGVDGYQYGHAYTAPLSEATLKVITTMKIEHLIVGEGNAQSVEVFLTDSERQLLSAQGYTLVRAENKSVRKGLSPKDVFTVGPLTQLATMIPLSIAGIGLREGAFVGLLRQQGIWIGPRIVLAASMWYFISVSVNILGAVLFMLRRSDYRKMLHQAQKQS
jgi:hypothetical protein